MIELYKKSTKGTKFNITGSFGMRKAYNYYRQNGTDKSLLIGREDFSSVIQEVNKRLVDSFATIGSVEFPAGMGGLAITSRDIKGVWINKEGEVKTNYPIDWVNTIKLWNEDHDAFIHRRLLRFENKTLCKIKYTKKGGGYKNKLFINLKPNTFLRRRIAGEIINKKVPVYESYKIIN